MFKKKKSANPKPYSLADLHAQRSSRRRIRVWLLLFFGTLILVGGVYVVFLSPIFNVQAFIFSTSSSFSEDVLLQELQTTISRSTLLSSVFKDKNILLWGDRRISTFSPDFLAVAYVDVHRDFLKRSVALTVQERERKLIWCHISSTDEDSDAAFRCFWIDGMGLVFEEAPQPRGGLVSSVYDYSSRSLKPGDYVLDENTLRNLFSIFDLFERFNFVVNDLALDDLQLREVTGTVTAGPLLYFSLDTNPSFALPVIESLIQSGEWNRISYLDLRVENKAYYSYK